MSSIAGWRRAILPFEVLNEVAARSQARLKHYLLDRKKRRAQQKLGPLQTNLTEKLARRLARLLFKEMTKTRRGQIYKRRQFRGVPRMREVSIDLRNDQFDSSIHSDED